MGIGAMQLGSQDGPQYSNTPPPIAAPNQPLCAHCGMPASQHTEASVNHWQKSLLSCSYPQGVATGVTHPSLFTTSSPPPSANSSLQIGKDGGLLSPNANSERAWCWESGSTTTKNQGQGQVYVSVHEFDYPPERCHHV